MNGEYGKHDIPVCPLHDKRDIEFNKLLHKIGRINVALWVLSVAMVVDITVHAVHIFPFWQWAIFP